MELVERQKLTAEKLAELLDRHVVAPMAAPPEEKPRLPEEIREWISRDIQTMSELPVLPQVCQRIIELAQDSESALKDWAAAIEMDPLSQAAIIRRARSSQYGFRGDIKDLQRAVVLLGKSIVKEVIVSGAVKQAFEGIAESGFKLQDYWLHSVTVGFAAKLLSFPLDEANWTAEQRREFDSWKLEESAVAELKRLYLYRMLAVDPVD